MIWKARNPWTMFFRWASSYFEKFVAMNKRVLSCSWPHIISLPICLLSLTQSVIDFDCPLWQKFIWESNSAFLYYGGKPEKQSLSSYIFNNPAVLQFWSIGLLLAFTILSEPFCRKRNPVFFFFFKPAYTLIKNQLMPPNTIIYSGNHIKQPIDACYSPVGWML